MRVYTVEEVEALEAFLDDGADEHEAKRLAELFEFKPVGRYPNGRKGKKYAWVLVEVPTSCDWSDEGDSATVSEEEQRVWVSDGDSVSVRDPIGILDDYSLEAEDYIEIRDEFADFWSYPGTLYHATDSDNIESILKYGLNPASDSRGFTNRGVGSAVFTTTNEDSAHSGTYGDAVFEIDTRAMKRDGYTPEVGGEPDVVEWEAKRALAWAFGIEDYEQDGPENDPETVIVYGPIPSKYLRLVD